MKILPFIFLIMFFSSASHAFFGMLGRDQCSYPSTPYPVVPQDYQHAQQAQVQGMYGQLQQMNARFQQLTADGMRLQSALRVQIQDPWVEPVLAHMDNGLDCCAPTRVYSVIDIHLKDRRPAGQDIDEPTYEAPQQTETTNAYPIGPVPEGPSPVPYEPPKVSNNNSCQGYPAQYCSTQWGQTYSPPQSGQLCLQTGFTATPAWYQAACRPGGKIDPQICSNPQIARNPADYQGCMHNLQMYERLTLEKRTLGAQIHNLSLSIQNYQSPNSSVANGGGSSETKVGSFLSGVGNFLSSVVSNVGPLVLNQYMSYQAQKNAYNNPGANMAIYGPPRPVMSLNGRMGPPLASYPIPRPPPPFYGPSYGYGFGYGGSYGAILPGYQSGGFGCSPGAAGGGQNLLSLLFGGAGLNSRLQASFGSNGGYAPYQAYLQGYGNQYSGIPSYSFQGYTPPYQPGSIYGTVPVYQSPLSLMNSYNAVPNFFANGGIGQTLRPPGTLVSPQPYSYMPNQLSIGIPGNNYGYQYNSYFYAQQLANQQRYIAAQAEMQRQQYNAQKMQMELQRLNNNYNWYYPNTYQSYMSGYQSPPYYGSYYSAPSYGGSMGGGIGGLLGSLLTGGSLRLNATGGF
ncbi:MAG: hypothetical protein H6623_00150 [Bdellovibrionaceae bacterium]|nr:hypothetical protein [Pseudobdellovibrionaceae bacterium]